MRTKWTEEQESVIQHREGNLLVSAAAGSGKTAVLVEHVISRITEGEKPESLSKLLIMTFTDAAAREMRERVQAALEKKLRENPDNASLVRELANLHNANISTIDSFCKRLISENYALLDNLDPGFRIGDEGELKLLKSDIIQEMMEEHYLHGEEDFFRFMDQFSRGKEDDGIEELILKLYDYASATPWPEDYLREANLKEEGRAEEFLLHALKEKLQDYLIELRYAVELSEEEGGPEEYLPMLREDSESIRRALAAEDVRTLAEELHSISFSTLKRTKSENREAVKDIRDMVKKKLQEMGKRLALPSEEEQEKLLPGIQKSIHILLELTLEFQERFRNEKGKIRMLDFSDLEHLALELLYTKQEDGTRIPSPLADDYAKGLSEILVDEYQDSNAVQEWLIRALSGERFGRPNVFQVGDVKQSIYSFRQARPELFLEKYEDVDYPTIELSKNFRSSYPVLHATNAVFYRLMKKGMGGIDYTERVSLHLGRERSKKDAENKAELLLTDYGELKLDNGEKIEVDKVEAESRLIARRIREFRKEGYAYRDMVILMRSPGGWADEMVEVLGNEGIPAYAISNEGYFSTVEVETVLAFLSIIDNPRQSIPLAAVMHSPIYDFSDAELARIKACKGGLERVFPGEEELRGIGKELSDAENGEELRDRETELDDYAAEGMNESGSSEADTVLNTEKNESEDSDNSLPPYLKEKLESFYRSLWHFREMSRYLSIHELLYCIYEETGYYEYVSAMPAGRKRRANLDQLIDSALQFEATSYKGLFDYIRYIEKLKKYHSDQGEASVYSEQEDLVRIISIHRSKGLQFPIAFLSGMGKKFNKVDLSGKILMDGDLGIAVDYVDSEKKLRYPSLKKLAIREKLENMQLGEELRVLYVGMTRAEEKLVMTAALSDVEKAVSKLSDREQPLSSSRIQGASSFLDWIFLSEGDRLLSAGETTPIRLKSYQLKDFMDSGTENICTELDLMGNIEEKLLCYDRSQSEYIVAERELHFHYPYEAATRLYPKHSVSEIKKQQGEQLKGEKLTAGKKAVIPEGIAILPELEYSEELLPTVKFNGLALESGNAYHHALASYDYERGWEQIKEKLPEKEYRLIKKEQLMGFVNSPLGELFRTAEREGRLFREKSFMKEVSYSYLFPESELEDKVLLQGVVDAFLLEEDGIILVDYKTDRVRSEKTLRERYSIQLKLYAEALEAITGKRVKERWIYSFALNKEILL